MSPITKILQQIEWPNFLFITLTPIIGIGGAYWMLTHGGPHAYTWILALFMMFATGLGITAGYHRLFSHRSYQASWVVKFILILFGGAAFQGSVREWCAAHRNHHRYVDQEKDPYNIKKGFWHAHVLWVILKADQSDESNIKDLLQDKLVMFQDRYFIPLAAGVSFLLPALIASLWGDPLGGLLFAGVLRVVVNHHLTFLINSYAHYFGDQTYSETNSAKDSWLLALLTYGEGYHNFHHAFETDYRNGVRIYHFDPSKWLIQFLSWFKLTWNLKKVRAQRILEARLHMQEKLIKLQKPHRFSRAEWQQFLTKARTNCEQIHARYMALKKEYYALKQQKLDSMVEKIAHLKNELETAKLEFKQAMQDWHLILKGQMVPVGA